MKRLNLLVIVVFSALLAHATVLRAAEDLTALGFLDVTALGADPTGQADSTEAIRKAVIAARDGQYVLFFPAGNYTISDTIECLFESKQKACRLLGSGTGGRAVLRLASNSPGFSDPAKPKVVLHVRRANEGNADHYEQSVMGIDIVVGEGNPGAVGVRLQGAENTHLQDMTIDLSASGYVGLWGPPGSGGSTHKLRIIGGQIGVNTFDARAIPGVDAAHPQNSQPTPVLTGITLENQSQYALTSDTRGPLVLVGCRIIRSVPGPVMLLRGKYQGDTLSAQVNLVDSIIEYTTYSDQNVVAEMDKGGRSFILENCYLRNAHCIFTADAPGRRNGWVHVRHFGYAHGKLPHELSEEPYRDGQPTGGPLLLESAEVAGPPADLISRHLWPDNFPTFQSPGVRNAQSSGAKGDGTTDDTAALQSAIDSAEIVFLPKGRYLITGTLRLKKNTKLIGVHSSLTQIITQDRAQQRFAGASASEAGIPMIEMPDVADGDVVIAGINIASSWPIEPHDPTQIESYAIRWQCNALFRDVHIHPNKQHPYHPAKALDALDPEYPDNGKYPSQMQYDVLPYRWPHVYATGNAQGRWYNFFLHGDHYQHPEGRLVKIEGTRKPISIYHFHCQHNQGDYYLETVNAHHVSIFGSKSEGMFAVALFRDSDHIRYFGHGGIGSPAPDNPRGIDWFSGSRMSPTSSSAATRRRSAARAAGSSATRRRTTTGIPARMDRATR